MADVAPDPTSKPTILPRGIATNLGLAGAAAAAIPVFVDLVKDGKLPERTIRLVIIVGAVLAGLAMFGRFAQAVAAIFAQALVQRREQRTSSTFASATGSASAGVLSVSPTLLDRLAAVERAAFPPATTDATAEATRLAATYATPFGTDVEPVEGYEQRADPVGDAAIASDEVRAMPDDPGAIPLDEGDAKTAEVSA